MKKLLLFTIFLCGMGFVCAMRSSKSKRSAEEEAPKNQILLHNATKKPILGGIFYVDKTTKTLKDVSGIYQIAPGMYQALNWPGPKSGSTLTAIVSFDVQNFVREGRPNTASADIEQFRKKIYVGQVGESLRMFPSPQPKGRTITDKGAIDELIKATGLGKLPEFEDNQETQTTSYSTPKKLADIPQEKKQEPKPVPAIKPAPTPAPVVTPTRKPSVSVQEVKSWQESSEETVEEEEAPTEQEIEPEAVEEESDY